MVDVRSEMPYTYLCHVLGHLAKLQARMLYFATNVGWLKLVCETYVIPAHSYARGHHSHNLFHVECCIL